MQSETLTSRSNPSRMLPRGYVGAEVELRRTVKPLAPAELERLIAALDGRSRVIVLLAGQLGLRQLLGAT